MRKLVTMRTIDRLTPIDGADAIEAAHIDGWAVVVKKGEFRQGDPVLYFEIDSFLPGGNPAWQFLVDKSSREFGGVIGHRLRTIKLRGQISQGLALRPSEFPDLQPAEDYAEQLGVVKYERVDFGPEQAKQVRRDFPAFLRRTDQERAQNLVHEIFEAHADTQYEVTIKLDGSSCTVYVRDGEIGVCSRNLELKINEDTAANPMVAIANQLAPALRGLGMNVALHGEMMGPKIQGNREGFAAHRFFVFDVWMIDQCMHASASLRARIIDMLRQMAEVRIAPVLHGRVRLADLGIRTMDGLLAVATGKSINNPVREGVVFKSIDGRFSFKVISNQFLLKEAA